MLITVRPPSAARENQRPRCFNNVRVGPFVQNSASELRREDVPDYCVFLIPKSLARKFDDLLEYVALRKTQNSLLYQQKLIYFLGSVSNKLKYGRHTNENPDQGVEINSRTAREVTGNDQTQIVADLVEWGLIEVERHYVVGERCRNYRLTEHGVSSRYFVWDEGLCERIQLQRLGKGYYQDEARMAVMQTLKTMEFDYEKATSLIEAYPLSEDEEHKRQCYYDQAKRIADRTFYVKRCPYGRIHNNITNLLSILRTCIKIDGEELCSVDIRCSQPFIFASLLTRWATVEIDQFEFDKTVERMMTCAVNGNSRIITAVRSGYDSEGRFQHSMASLRERFRMRLTEAIEMARRNPEAMQRFLSVCREMDYYEEFAKAGVEGMTLEDLARSRSAFKKKMFVVFFGPTLPVMTSAQQAWADAHPEVYEIIVLLKREESSMLPKLMQTLESSVCIDVVTTTLVREGHHVLPLHDSVNVKTDGLDRAVELMLTSFDYRPAIEIERNGYFPLEIKINEPIPVNVELLPLDAIETAYQQSCAWKQALQVEQQDFVCRQWQATYGKAISLWQQTQASNVDVSHSLSYEQTERWSSRIAEPPHGDRQNPCGIESVSDLPELGIQSKDSSRSDSIKLINIHGRMSGNMPSMASSQPTSVRSERDGIGHPYDQETEARSDQPSRSANIDEEVFTAWTPDVAVWQKHCRGPPSKTLCDTR